MKEIMICLIVTASIVYIWDISGFVNELANYIAEVITGGRIKRITLRKPFGCSLCMSTWITLFILLIMNWKLAPLALVFGWFSTYIFYIFQIIDMGLTRIFEWIQNIIRK